MTDLTPEEMVERILHSLRKTGEQFTAVAKEKPARGKSRKSGGRSRAKRPASAPIKQK